MSDARMIDRPSIRLHQTHDASGTPAPDEFLEILPPAPIHIPTGAFSMRFLAPLNPSRTDRELAYLYSDPTRGSGWLELEGFGDRDARRVQEMVWMEEIERVVGTQPRKNPDTRVPQALAPRYNNPWVYVVWGLLVIGLGLYVFSTRALHPEAVVFGTVISLLLMTMGATLIVVTARKRVPWWHRARQHSRQSGELHPDLEVWS